MGPKFDPFNCALQIKGEVRSWEITSRRNGLNKLGVVETDGKGFHAFLGKNGDEISTGKPFPTVRDAALAIWYHYLITRYGQ